ncbi:hypothetical protein [Anaerotruncus rubiinfantis]|uniref:hypothetical protein n=1 Tax=Anaerotruncus rubiinfantis TaxID=1720200 RepID=UPI00189A2991|nr:hypothetical protein [Anaerotruncus rubiinfantis]
MKRFLTGLLILSLAFCCACSRGPAPSASPSAPGRESAPAQAESAVPQADLSAVAGKYVSEPEGVDEQYWPTLTLREDGTFLFRVNLFAGMGRIEGSYLFHEADKTITLQVESRNFEGGVMGETMNEFYFDVASDESLMYRGNDDPELEPIGVTNPYDLFKRTTESSSAG